MALLRFAALETVKVNVTLLPTLGLVGVAVLVMDKLMRGAGVGVFVAKSSPAPSFGVLSRSA